MSEVYRARNRKLGRDVAIKMLPASFARDVERLPVKREWAEAKGWLHAELSGGGLQ